MNDRLRLSAAFVIAASLAASAGAGPLVPPPGPVAPTMKTLDETEPRIPLTQQTTPGLGYAVFVIQEPGSYYLTGNVSAEPNKAGIIVTADNVTLDLNGFTLDGQVPQGAAPSLEGIQGYGSAIHVRNGTVHGWGGSGVALAQQARIEHLTVSGNGGDGISTAMAAIVRNCVAWENSGVGIWVAASSTVSDCASRANGGHGFETLSLCTITGCTAEDNGGAGFKADPTSSFARCVARLNDACGFEAGRGSSIADCNASFNAEDGFRLSDGCVIQGCTAAENQGDGIQAGDGSAIAACSVSRNAQCGVFASSGCTIRENTAHMNGTTTTDAGIHGGGRCRIDSNHVTQNKIGIRVMQSGSLLIRNSASGNTVNNYSWAAGNTIGPIVNGSGTIASEHAWSNFSN